MSDFLVKVGLPKIDRIECITIILVRDTSRQQAFDEALQNMRRMPWLRLSDIEINKVICMEIKTY